MNPVSEKSTGSSINFGGATGSLLNLLKAYEESSKNQIKAEEELNKLKFSNLMRLGLLKKEQENEILSTRLAAEKRILDERKKLMEEHLAREMDAEKAKRLAAIADLSEEERKIQEAAITAAIAAETAQKKADIDALVDYEYAEREKAAKKELKDAKKRKKQELEAEKKEKEAENKELLGAFGKPKEGQTVKE